MFYQNTPNNSRTQNSTSCGRTPVNGCGNSNPPCPPPGCMSSGNMSSSGCMQTSGSTMPGRKANCQADYECGNREGYLDQYPVAMAYIPWQPFGEIFPLERGFQVGTIFQNLDFPFTCASPACKSCIQPRNMRGGRR